MKARRHDAILRLVRDQPVRSQEDLRQLLQAEGIEITQATLSRDIRELGLAKAVDAAGATYYAPPGDETVPSPPWEHLIKTLLVSLDGVGNLVVIRTAAGSASALAHALDRQELKGIVGTVAGDDTILIVTRSERARRAVTKQLEALGSGG